MERFEMVSYPEHFVVGYARIGASLLACLTMRYTHTVTLFLYFVSAILDAADGHAARALNQSTKFGAMLDQLVDRCATLTLLICLANFYPGQTIFFQIAAVIDISCHWIHLHACVPLTFLKIFF
ncbi:unnamed protein product [Notodromas monacha]|uniref:CDP-diacylglycerol--inositol 3-phosphatidyltransferase n=1 Tax=Notodromas monacha TaxID=399045 RepID=A0A7R9BS69_9CRUS|nr:unnamed protein product [Notodromas monacha]CAG0920718.1 unnamed protein product [Notodromas monacha]